jgi:hypothetical protein
VLAKSHDGKLWYDKVRTPLLERRGRHFWKLHMARNYYDMIDLEPAILCTGLRWQDDLQAQSRWAWTMDLMTHSSKGNFKIDWAQCPCVPCPPDTKIVREVQGGGAKEGKMETSKSMSANPVRQHADGEKSKDDRKSEPGVKGVVSAEY